MKKIMFSIVLALLMAPALVGAQTITWDTRTSATMAWDASPKVATTDDANRYQVLWRTDLTSAGTAVGSPITATQLALTIPPDVKYYFGVKALRYQAGVRTAESAVAWSSDPIATNNTPWGFDTTRSPLAPSAIRLLP
jgi:hypothetical protein